MSIANFFKKKDKLDYTRMVVCPLEGKKYFPEKGKNICPACGREFENPVGGPEHTIRMRKSNGHEIYFCEGGFEE